VYHNSLDYVSNYHVCITTALIMWVFTMSHAATCTCLHMFAQHFFLALACTALFPGIDALQLEDVRWCSREDVAAAVRMYDADQCAGGSSGGEWCCLIDLLID
jgi:hypothetical protein